MHTGFLCPGRRPKWTRQISSMVMAELQIFGLNASDRSHKDAIDGTQHELARYLWNAFDSVFIEESATHHGHYRDLHKQPKPEAKECASKRWAAGQPAVEAVRIDERENDGAVHKVPKHPDPPEGTTDRRPPLPERGTEQRRDIELRNARSHRRIDQRSHEGG